MKTVDVVIIGAGPCGLFQIFQLGLQGLNCAVVETLPQPGGQCSELYPDKPIYDIPAWPAISAAELSAQLLKQAEPFAAEFFFNQTVTHVEQLDDGFRLLTDLDTELRCKAVVIAAGAGAFNPVKLKVPDIEQFLDSQLFYAVKDREIHRDKDLVILGGGNSALDWALELQQIANSVVLINRSERFRADPASVAEMQKRCADLEMQYMTGSVTGFHSDSRLKQVKVQGRDGVTRVVDLDQLLVFFGQTPKPGPVLDWGLENYRNQIVVDTENFETSRPGIYAVGDINWYPGKRKLILSGFHEAALAAFAIKQRMTPERRVCLQYTTTSPVLHDRLGVHPDISDLTES